MSKGLQVGLSYTYSNYMSDIGLVNGGGNSDIQNHACISCNWGPMPDDFTQVFTLNHLYQIPFGPHRRYLNQGLAGAIFGNWDINGIWSAHTGGRFTPILGTNVSNSQGGGSQRPNRIASGNLSGASLQQWFDTAAFVAPASYTFGNSGTGILTGPAYFNADLGVVRRFQATERLALNLRGEAFNTFNHANFNNPNATIGTASAGVISGTSSPRVLQVSVKVVF